MNTTPMVRTVPTTAQAERLRQLFGQAIAKYPQHTEILRGFERAIIQQPDDSGNGLPEPIEAMVEELVESLLQTGPLQKHKLRKAFRDAQA